MSQSSENTAASQDEDPATLTHQGKPNCTVTATTHLQQQKANEKISPNFKMSTGKLPRWKICRRKLIKFPTVTWAAMCGTTCTVWTKISDGDQLRGFGSLLTKILFSYRSTEVSGTLIVMKVPTERSRSWGRRTGKTANLWKCLKPTASDSLLGSCTRKYSPYGKIKYDTCFEMIDVVPFEMIYDKFRAVVVWPATAARRSGTTRFEMTDDCPIDMIYDLLFDIKWQSLRNDLWLSFR